MKAEYISHYLTDNDVANIARHSFDKLDNTFSEEANNNLIRFLARGIPSGDWDDLVDEMTFCADRTRLEELANYLRKIPTHWAPFAHPHITLKMDAPVPIRTQCFKHKQGLVESEVSRRYISSIPSIFVPEYFRPSAENVKQGSAVEPHPSNEFWLEEYKDHTAAAVELYRVMIEDGVCPEQARFVLPQGAEVAWVWTGSLYAFANFYIQRIDSHAQKEIQLLAEEVSKIIEPLFPVSWKALTGT